MHSPPPPGRRPPQQQQQQVIGYNKESNPLYDLRLSVVLFYFFFVLFSFFFSFSPLGKNISAYTP